MARRAGTTVYNEGQTRAERFVDDVTLLRMIRLRMPNVKPELGGFDQETIKHCHTSDATLERWDNHDPASGLENNAIVDVAYRFPGDGSVAVRMKATGRWEVWRTWP